MTHIIRDVLEARLCREVTQEELDNFNEEWDKSGQPMQTILDKWAEREHRST